MSSANATLWIPYCGAAPDPGQWSSAFNLDPLLLIVLVLTAFSARALETAAERRRVYLAIGVALFLFVSPFCALGSALFAARVVHHLVLVLALAPLLAHFDFVGRFARRAPLAFLTALQIVTFWAWHAPPLYSAALSSDAVFWAMQVTLCFSAALWWARLREAQAGPVVISLLATMVLMGLLAALLTFSDTAFYEPHWLTTQSWGFSPLEDQQLAGILMWVPGSLAYLFLALTVLYRSMELEPAR